MTKEDGMILVPPKYLTKKLDKASLKQLVKDHPDIIYIQGGTNVQTNQPWEGYVSAIPYKTTVMTKHDKKTYGFRQLTDGTFEAF